MIDLAAELRAAILERARRVEAGEDPCPIVVGGVEYVVAQLSPGNVVVAPRAALEAVARAPIDMPRDDAEGRERIAARVREILAMQTSGRGQAGAFLHCRAEDAAAFLAPEYVPRRDVSPVTGQPYQMPEAYGIRTAPDEPPPFAPSINRRAGQRCATCGGKIRPGHVKCPECGTRRDGTSQPRGRGGAQKARRA